MINKENLKNILENHRSVKGFSLLLFFSLISYSLLALINNFSLITGYILDPTNLITLLTTLVAGYHTSINTTALIIAIITSIMIGINLSLLTQSLTIEGLSATPGTLFGLAVAGCTACAPGVIGIAGFSIGLGFLPYAGMEISILGILMLTASSLYISEKDMQKVCKVK